MAAGAISHGMFCFSRDKPTHLLLGLAVEWKGRKMPGDLVVGAGVTALPTVAGSLLSQGLGTSRIHVFGVHTLAG